MSSLVGRMQSEIRLVVDDSRLIGAVDAVWRVIVEFRRTHHPFCASSRVR